MDSVPPGGHKRITKCMRDPQPIARLAATYSLRSWALGCRLREPVTTDRLTFLALCRKYLHLHTVTGINTRMHCAYYSNNIHYDVSSIVYNLASISPFFLSSSQTRRQLRTSFLYAFHRSIYVLIALLFAIMTLCARPTVCSPRKIKVLDIGSFFLCSISYTVQLSVTQLEAVTSGTDGAESETEITKLHKTAFSFFLILRLLGKN